MSDLVQSLYAKAKAVKRHIVLPEGQDVRVIEGAKLAQNLGLAQVTLLNASEQGVNTIQISDVPDIDHYIAELARLREHKGMTLQKAREAILNPLIYAALMVKLGEADGTLAGAVSTTADTVRTAFQIIGLNKGIHAASSFFLMILPDERLATFADCALSVDPDAEHLADIAIAAADNHSIFTNQLPRIAMLSFSTLGSAHHERVEKVAQATQIVQTKRPDLIIAGELQFDAAFIPSIAHSKAPNSLVQGDANVFVFPSLEAGNIGYKIAQRIGQAKAIGPILQGLAAPANDLSRGCSAQDVCDMIAITAIQASQL